MIGLASELWKRLATAHRSGGRLLLLFDYDGTLVPLAPHPELAVLDRHCRRLLANLAQLPRVFVGVVSGRSLDDLQGMVGMTNVLYAGVSGLELDLGGMRIEHDSAKHAVVVIRHVFERLEATLADFPGAWLENKRIGMTVHVRHMAPERIPELRTRVVQVVHELAHPLRLVDGPLAIEITPAGEAHKGSAIHAFLHFLGTPEAMCLYAGDDANDAEAFEEIAARGGVCIGIGAHAPQAAQHRLDTPQDLMAMLRELFDDLCARS
jgi:trehalose 6-phosphate phosphatase